MKSTITIMKATLLLTSVMTAVDIQIDNGLNLRFSIVSCNQFEITFPLPEQHVDTHDTERLNTEGIKGRDRRELAGKELDKTGRVVNTEPELIKSAKACPFEKVNEELKFGRDLIAISDDKANPQMIICYKGFVYEHTIKKSDKDTLLTEAYNCNKLIKYQANSDDEEKVVIGTHLRPGVHMKLAQYFFDIDDSDLDSDSESENSNDDDLSTLQLLDEHINNLPKSHRHDTLTSDILPQNVGLTKPNNLSSSFYKQQSKRFTANRVGLNNRDLWNRGNRSYGEIRPNGLIHRSNSNGK
jgi:hypothetical protein